jgi:hypothetical protein
MQFMDTEEERYKYKREKLNEDNHYPVQTQWTGRALISPTQLHDFNICSAVLENWKHW